MEVPRNLLFWVFILVIILLVFFSFIPQVIALGTKAQTLVSPATKEKEEIVEEGKYRPLGITYADSPEVKMYKLFRNFDPLFLNETVLGTEVTYNPFILDLKGNDYKYDGVLITMLIDGIRNFSAFDNYYQIGIDDQQGTDGKPTCRNPEYAWSIDYSSDCWNVALDISLGFMDDTVANPNPCVIFFHTNDTSGRFDNRVKIRVGWLLGGVSATGRQIIYTITTVCDG